MSICVVILHILQTPRALIARLHGGMLTGSGCRNPQLSAFSVVISLEGCHGLGNGNVRWDVISIVSHLSQSEMTSWFQTEKCAGMCMITEVEGGLRKGDASSWMLLLGVESDFLL